MPKSWILAILLGGLAAVAPVHVQKGGEDETGPYDVVANWLKPLPHHEGWTWGQMGGVYAETADRIFIVMRGETRVPNAPPGTSAGSAAAAQPQPTSGGTPEKRKEHSLFVVNRNGELIEEWNQWEEKFVQAHKVTIDPYDPEKHVWVTDTAAHQVFKFSHDGKQLVMALGEWKVPGDDEKHFNQPADIAFLPDGSFYVADGYVNARVAKFDRNGTFLMSWGTKGAAPGQFDLVHDVAFDAKRRLYVIDRNNHRIQIFDESGTFLDMWEDIQQATDLLLTEDQFMWVADGVNNRMLKYDLNGTLLTYWGVSDRPPNRQGPPLLGALNDPHQISVDPEGNLYIANYYTVVKKFTPKRNPDRSRLIGQPFRFRTSAN